MNDTPDNGSAPTTVQRMRYWLRLLPGSPNMLGSEGSFAPQIGVHWSPGESPVGYYIDFRLKAQGSWPPFWLSSDPWPLFIPIAQWGLGAYERFLHGDGERWLKAALGAGEHLLSAQEHGGPREGGWVHRMRMPHTFPVSPPWLSAMAQGEGASLLARLYRETEDERYCDAALRALQPMELPVSQGGTLTEYQGHSFLEEYPTETPSCVLNGAIFAIWGLHDVGRILGDETAMRRFEEMTTALASLITLFDSGYWSRYDLYPHPIRNIATPAYHLLHIRQLTVLNRLSPRTQFPQVIERFENYRGRRINRGRAVAAKVAFRLRVPRNQLLAHRGNGGRESIARRRGTDALVLCYHAISSSWPADLSTDPNRFAEQLEHLLDKGYRGVTFSEAVTTQSGKVVAVTFDDGYRSVLELAAPIMKTFGIPGTLFVTTDFIGGEKLASWPGVEQWLGTEHEHELAMMSWPEVKRLQSAGWEIGSHTRLHPYLTRLLLCELEEELAESRQRCAKELGSCESIAYPYGDHDEVVIAATAAAGYKAAAALPPDMPPPHQLAWPRIGIYRNDDMRAFRLKVSPLVRRARGSGGGLIAKQLRDAKRLLTG